MWDERYKDEEYVYGTSPNVFLKENVSILQNPVLSLGEGEGRNAVYLASVGFNVLGVDSSEVGLEKAKSLARKKGVKIQTKIADLSSYEPCVETYRSVISIFAHLPSKVRSKLYPLVAQSLKVGGIILLEAYSESQIARDTGGPKDLDMLLTMDKLIKDFPGIEPLHLVEVERDVSEGKYHSGLASVIQFIGRKTAISN